MAIPPFVNGDGSPSYCQMMLQASLGIALYRDDRPGALALLQGVIPDAQIIFWYKNPQVATSVFVYSSGNDFGCVVAGSEQPYIAAQYIVRTTDVPYPIGGGLVNSYAWQVFNNVLPRIAQYIPTNRSGLRVFVSGHSLGGSVANLIANNYVQSIGRANVSCMAIDMPKVLTANTTAVPPANSVMVAVPLSPIAYQPCQGWMGYFSNGFVNYVLSSFGREWTHQLPCYLLGNDGSAKQVPASFFNDVNIATASSWDFGQHNLGLILAKIISGWQAAGGGQPCNAILAQAQTFAVSQAASETWGSGDVGTYVNPNYINSTDFSDADGGLINNSNRNQIIFQSGTIDTVTTGSLANIAQQGELMANAWSAYFQVGMCINDSAHGRMEHHVLKDSVGLNHAITSAADLVTNRAFLLGIARTPPSPLVKSITTPCIEAIRFSDGLNPQNSYLKNTAFDKNYFGLNGGNIPSGDFTPDFPSTALSIRIQGQNENNAAITEYANISIQFIPDAVCVGSQFNGSLIGSNGNTYATYLAQYLNELTSNPAHAWGFLGLSLAQPKKTAKTFTVNAGNMWQAVCTAHGYSDGDRLRLSGAKVAGWAGTHRITVIDANTIQFDTPSNTNLDAPAQATVQKVFDGPTKTRKLDFYRYIVPPTGSWAGVIPQVRKKNTGRQLLQASFSKRRART